MSKSIKLKNDTYLSYKSLYQKSLTLSGEWQIAQQASGAGWMLAVPFNNPLKKTPTFSGSGDFFWGSWQSLTSVSVFHYNENAVFLTLSGISGTTANNCLVRLNGIISI